MEKLQKYPDIMIEQNCKFWEQAHGMFEVSVEQVGFSV
jgi:hypothetical protein